VFGIGLLDRIRQRDPGYAVLRRAVRLTLVASGSFYLCRYGLGNPVLATYALFGTIATGVFASLPGSPRARAEALLAALPVAWVLIAVGTTLARSTWAAAAGMLVLGFAVAFAAVGGPRLLGLASAFQLFYILASFPPYQSSTLPARLGGATLGVVLLAAAEVVLWPDPVPVSYQQRLAEAADRLAAFLEAVAGTLTDPPGDRRELDVRRDQAYESVARLRLAQLPAAQRPTAAGARDRALRDCATALQEVVDEAARLAAQAPPQPVPDLQAARLLRRCARTTRSAGRGLLSGTPRVVVRDLAATSGSPEAADPADPARPGYALDVRRLCLDATALTLCEEARFFAISALVAAGSRIADEGTSSGTYRRSLDYARHGPSMLYWARFRAHLTLRSAPFQTALRLAVALAAARVAAGLWNLMNGFWVLLATLTVLRTSAADTRMALRPAVLGTIVGAVAGGLVLLLATRPVIYAVALPFIMVVAFSGGRLLGPVLAQALFTVQVTFAFAQLAPAGWRLAEARLLDFLVGGAIGVTAGVVIWPRGASADLRRSTAAQLAAGADVIEKTVEAVIGEDRPDHALDRAHRALILADAAYSQYHSERPDRKISQVDWLAALGAGRHVIRSAESLLHRNPPGCLASWSEAAALLRSSAGKLRSAYAEAAEQLGQGRSPRPMANPARCVDELDRMRPLVDQPGSQLPLGHLVEVDLWLAGLADHLARIQPLPDQPWQH
jgi:uncharacterized membrane protein YccC